MTTRLDAAVIKLRIDTAAAEKRLKDMKESQSKVEKESEGIKQAVEKKRAQDRKERRAGRSGSMFGGLFGRARAGGRFVRGAAVNPMGALAVIPYVGLIVGIMKLMETIILPLARSVAKQAVKDAIPGEGTIEDAIADGVDAALGAIQNQITELQAAVVAAGAATSQSWDYAKKANLMTGDLPSVDQMGDFWGGSYGWNQHVYRMSVFGNRAVMGQLGNSIYGAARRATGIGGPQ